MTNEKLEWRKPLPFRPRPPGADLERWTMIQEMQMRVVMQPQANLWKKDGIF